jgi:DNA-binding transcriptional regulator LsrR (DeoR family)
VIGVAGGAEKTAAIRGAIATGALDEIAVDVTLATALLDN